jgi:hypothetical protein
MSCLAVLLLATFPLVAPPVPSHGVASQLPDPVEKFVQAYCDRHGLDRKKVEPWQSALAPDGCVFRYKLPADSAQGKRKALPERHALVFVDPDAGNVYDVKQTPGEGDRNRPADQRTWAILRLMGTKAADEKRAQALMADLFRAHWSLGSVHRLEPFTVQLIEVRKGETWADPAVTYIASLGKVGRRLIMKVDEEGSVMELYIGNIR